MDPTATVELHQACNRIAYKTSNYFLYLFYILIQ